MKKIWLLIFIIWSIFVLWCGKSQELKTIENWDKVSITYSSNFENWDVFQENNTLEITVWKQETIKWLEQWIIWMKQWEEKEILVEANLWYWDKYDDTKVQQIAKFIFDRLNLIPELWKEYEIWNIKWKVKSIEWDWDYTIIMLDTNPRETYENLLFKVKIEKIIE